MMLLPFLIFSIYSLGSISGYVISNDGTPIGNALVRVTIPSANQVEETYTDPNGFFGIVNLDFKKGDKILIYVEKGIYKLNTSFIVETDTLAVTVKIYMDACGDG